MNEIELREAQAKFETTIDNLKDKKNGGDKNNEI